MRRFDREKLRSLRESKGYSLGMLAKLLKVKTGKLITRSAISHWERGDASPRTDGLVALCDLFEVPMDFFFIRQTNSLFDRAGQLKAPAGANSPGPDPGQTAARRPSEPSPKSNPAATPNDEAQPDQTGS